MSCDILRENVIFKTIEQKPFAGVYLFVFDRGRRGFKELDWWFCSLVRACPPLNHRRRPLYPPPQVGDDDFISQIILEADDVERWCQEAATIPQKIDLDYKPGASGARTRSDTFKYHDSHVFRFRPGFDIE